MTSCLAEGNFLVEYLVYLIISILSWSCITNIPLHCFIHEKYQAPEKEREEKIILSRHSMYVKLTEMDIYYFVATQHHFFL